MLKLIIIFLLFISNLNFPVHFAGLKEKYVCSVSHIANRKFIVLKHFAVHFVKFCFTYRLIEIHCLRVVCCSQCQDILIGHCFAHYLLHVLNNILISKVYYLYVNYDFNFYFYITFNTNNTYFEFSLMNIVIHYLIIFIDNLI